jgi:hypothetical protein
MTQAGIKNIYVIIHVNIADQCGPNPTLLTPKDQLPAPILYQPVGEPLVDPNTVEIEE